VNNEYFSKNLSLLFGDEIVPASNLIDVLTYILRTYTRLRGNDRVCKLLAVQKLSPKLHIRQDMAAVSNKKLYESKKAGKLKKLHEEILSLEVSDSDSSDE